MSIISAITMMLSLFSGIALFLFGMQLMGDGLKRAAGKSLEHTLYRLTSSPIKGILLGTAVTAVIQSSSATTVMVVGFVNAGMMKVSQSIGIIMGANIGTSITGWILCLSYLDGGGSSIAALLSTATLTSFVAIVGILFKKLSSKATHNNLGDIMLGFAILMVGMKTMSSAVEPLKESEAFVNMFTMFSNPFMGILVGIAFTAVLQSASASVGILQALSVTGAITFATALPITMGIGVGAACPVLISAIGTSKNGKRTALIYLLNDLFGMIFWSIVFYSVNAFAHFAIMDQVMTPFSTALLNTVFRVATILVLSPFIPMIEKLVFRLVRDSEEDLEDQADFDLLEKRFLDYPAVAIKQTETVIHGMAKKSRKNVLRALKLLDEYNPKTYEKLQEKEALIDRYEEKLGAYVMQINARELTEAQNNETSIYLHVISDYERISDYAAHIGKAANEIHEKEIVYSEAARRELTIVEEAVREIVRLTVRSFIEKDVETAKRIEPLRRTIEMDCDELKLRHVMRLQTGECELEHGFTFNDMLAGFIGIAQHCAAIAVVMIKVGTDDFNTHEYLRNRRAQSSTYNNDLHSYMQKYDIDQPLQCTEETE